MPRPTLRLPDGRAPDRARRAAPARRRRAGGGGAAVHRAVVVAALAAACSAASAAGGTRCPIGCCGRPCAGGRAGARGRGVAIRAS